MQNFSFAFGLE